MTSTDESTRELDVDEVYLHRAALFMRRGGRGRVLANSRELIRGIWRTALRPDGAELHDETLLILEFCVNAVIGLVSYAGSDEMLAGHAELPSAYIRDVVRRSIDTVAHIEGATRDEVQARLQAIRAVVHVDAPHAPADTFSARR